MSLAAQADSTPVHHVNVTAEDIAVNLLIFILSSFLGLVSSTVWRNCCTHRSWL